MGAGRPRGSKNKNMIGMPFDKRMKVLQKIITGNTSSASEILQAIKLMTEMLNDKIVATQAGVQETVLTFGKDNKDIPEIIASKLPENTTISVNIDENVSNVASITTNSPILPLEQENNSVSNVSSLTLDFTVDTNAKEDL